jgi:hypothetical protein
VLYLVSLLFPYWLFIMDAPAYPEKDLSLMVYADRLVGDLTEWGTVSKLVGIQVPPPLPELDLKLIPAIILVLAALALVSAFRGHWWLKLTTITSWATLTALMAWMQYRLYLVGHNLDPTAPLRRYVEPFTPPVIGWITIGGKITVYHWPHLGALLFLAATLIATLTLVRLRRSPSAQGGGPRRG